MPEIPGYPKRKVNNKMKKLMFAAILTAGAFCMTGCEKKSESEQLKDDAAAMSEKAQKQAGDAANAAGKAAGDAVDSLKKAFK